MRYAEIAHQMPGRVRIRVPTARDNPELLEAIRQAFADLPGLRATRLKPEAGSIVLQYDVAEAEAFERHLARQWNAVAPTLPHKPRKLLKATRRPGDEIEEMAHKIEVEAEFLAGHSHLAHAIFDFFKQADRELKIVTNNAVDLKIVLAVALAVATFAGIGAHAATPMWVTLALFAINHFIEMHSPAAGAAERHASRATA
jgi:hypothetical protein